MIVYSDNEKKLFEEAKNLYKNYKEEKYPDIAFKYLNELYGMIKAIKIMGYNKKWKKFCNEHDIEVDFVDFNGHYFMDNEFGAWKDFFKRCDEMMGYAKIWKILNSDKNHIDKE